MLVLLFVLILVLGVGVGVGVEVGVGVSVGVGVGDEVCVGVGAGVGFTRLCQFVIRPLQGNTGFANDWQQWQDLGFGWKLSYGRGIEFAQISRAFEQDLGGDRNETTKESKTSRHSNFQLKHLP